MAAFITDIKPTFDHLAGVGGRPLVLEEYTGDRASEVIAGL